MIMPPDAFFILGLLTWRAGTKTDQSRQ